METTQMLATIRKLFLVILRFHTFSRKISRGSRFRFLVHFHQFPFVSSCFWIYTVWAVCEYVAADKCNCLAFSNSNVPKCDDSNKRRLNERIVFFLFISNCELYWRCMAQCSCILNGTHVQPTTRGNVLNSDRYVLQI